MVSDLVTTRQIDFGHYNIIILVSWELEVDLKLFN